MIIDTHIHLDDTGYNEDLDAVLERAGEAGVGLCIIPGADIDDLPRARELSERFDHIYFAAGVHPYHAHQYNGTVLEHFLAHPKCVAVGECGPDYFRLPESDEAIAREKQLQKEVFTCHIELAIKHDLPLIVHVREASQDSFDLLSSYQEKGVRGVLHCFNASELLLKLSETFYYGIGGVLTFKNAKKLVNILPKIPKERLVIETDGPYLTPHPHRGTRNEPAFTQLVSEKMGEVLGMPTDEVIALTSANALTLFSHMKVHEEYN
jgi:TatD DNase family protein